MKDSNSITFLRPISCQGGYPEDAPHPGGKLLLSSGSQTVVSRDRLVAPLRWPTAALLLAAAITVMGVGALTGTAAFGSAGSTSPREMEVGGIQRTYSIHLPSRFPGGRPAGLVLVLHGGGGNGRQIERHTGFSPLADREGFIAVYPDAVDRNWNDGRGAAGISAQRQNVDDV